MDKGHQAIIRVCVHLLPMVFFLVGWHLICAGNQQRTFFFSTPLAVAQQFWSDIESGTLFLDTAITASEAVSGFVLATVVGTSAGLLLASSLKLSEIAAPYLRLLGTVPIYALAPMTIVWFGIGFEQKMVVAFLSCVFVATNQAFQGASHPPDEYILIFRSFQATSWRVLWSLRLPSALSWVSSGCRLNVGFAILGAFLAEVISSNRGLGHYIMKASGLYDVPRVLSGILALLILGFLMDKAVSALATFYRTHR